MGADRKETGDQEGPPGPDPSLEIKRLKKELMLRSELARVVTSFRSPKELLPNILSILCEGFGANGGAIFFMDKDTNEILLRSSYGLEPAYIIKYQKIHLGSHVTGKVAESGEGVIIEDAARDKRSTKGVVDILKYRSAVVTPVTSEEEVVGIIALINEQPNAFEQKDLKKLEFIGAHISLAIVNSFLNEEIREERERTMSILESIDEGIFEVELREAMDKEGDVNNLVVEFNRNGKFSLVNPSFIRQSGVEIKIGDEMVKAFEEIQLFRMLKEALTKGEVKGIERKWIGERERLLEVSMFSVEKDGMIKGIKGVRRDVTNRLRAEESVLEAKSKMEFHMDLLAHDISNINTSVLGFLDVIDTRLRSPMDLRRYISLSKREVLRSSQLIRKIKTLSRIMNEKPSLSCSDLSKRIQDNFDIVKRQYPDRVTKLEDLGTQGEMPVICDELVDELLQNIFKVLMDSLAGEQIEIVVNVKDYDFDEKKGYLFTISEGEIDGVGLSKGRMTLRRGDLELTWGLIDALVERYKGKIWTEGGDREKGPLRIMVFLPGNEM